MGAWRHAVELGILAYTALRLSPGIAMYTLKHIH